MKKVCLLALAAATATATAPSAVAQISSHAGAETLEAMSRLEMMVGEWTGTSTTQMGPRGEQTVNVTERASRHAGGEVLVVEGRGWREVDGDEQVVHDAFGAITWDAATDTYRIRSYRAGQGWVDADIQIDGKQVGWQFESPGGTLRFTADYSTPDRWIEVGEIERGGEWRQFLRMELDRVETSPAPQN